MLGRSLPEPVGPLDFDGFAIVDILVDEGAIAKIAPAGAVDFRRRAGSRDVGAHRAAAVRRRPHPSRQGPYLAAQAQPGRRFSKRARGDDRGPRGQLERRRRRRAHGVQPALAYAHGTTAHSHPYRQRRRRRRESAGRFSPKRESAGAAGSTLQASPLFSVELASNASHMADIEAMLDAHGTGILGAATRMVPELREGLGVLFDLAERKGWELDFHVDESSDPAARSLKVIADMAIERRFERPILVGHCCSLALQEDDERRRTIDAVARAGLSVVSLPMCNMFLQDRHAGRTPRWRGVTALHELKARRRQCDDRQRQHPRSVLRLWRSRHDGSVARGRADPAPRLSLRRLGARRLGFSGQGDGARPRRPASRARAPT